MRFQHKGRQLWVEPAAVAAGKPGVQQLNEPPAGGVPVSSAVWYNHNTLVAAPTAQNAQGWTGSCANWLFLRVHSQTLFILSQELLGDHQRERV